MNEFGIAVIVVFAVLLMIIFSTFFSARLAQLKRRSRAWGVLGLFLGVVGLVIVCFLPSKRKDNMQTNPIIYALSRLPSPSRKTIGMLVGLVIAVVMTIIAYDNIPVIIQNYKYSHSGINETGAQDQPKIIDAAVKSVFAGDDCSFVVAENGDLYCWGRQLVPQLENEPRGVIYKNVKKALSTKDALLILTNDGELYGTGGAPLPQNDAQEGQLRLIASDVSDFSMSETTMGYIGGDNKLYMCGAGAFGQLGAYDNEDKSEPVAVLGNVSKVCCEATFTIALQRDGEAVGFGCCTSGQLEGEEKSVNSPISLSKGVKDIAAGDEFTMLLFEDGTLSLRGANDYGQLGGTVGQDRAEVHPALSGISRVFAAKCSAYAINEGGELYAWGQNNVGQLGDGDTKSTSAPKKVASDVADIAVSGLHTILLKTDGKVSACGYDDSMQLGRGGGRNSFDTLVSVKGG